MTTYESLQIAIFERYDSFTKWHDLSAKHHIPVGVLRRAFASWLRDAPAAQPTSYRDIQFERRLPGRPLLLSSLHTKVIIEALQYFADNNTPLTRQGARQLVRTYIEMLPCPERKKITLSEHGPSDTCLNSMMARHGLSYKHVQVVEDSRLNAIKPDIVSEHIARVQSAMDRYHIHDAKFIFNTDQSGSSFKRMCGRSLRKGFGKKNEKLQQACVKTKGQLDRVTVMPCVSAVGKAYKPVIVFPGKQPHYRKVRGVTQDLYTVLPDCYLHYREVPGADSAIVYDWALNFLEETKCLREKGQHLLLLLDGYSAHIQFRTLELFRRNRIVVIALPAHSSHRLQPLDVTVFSPYKSYLQAEIHNAAQFRSVLGAFDIGTVIANAYSKCMTMSNIRNGFTECGIWDPVMLRTNIGNLEHLFSEDLKVEKGLPGVVDLVNGFLRKGRSLLREAEVQEAGTIKIKTTKGAHLTSNAVIDALKVRESRRARSTVKDQMGLHNHIREPAADVRRLAELADARHDQRKRLRETREHRRVRQKIRLSGNGKVF